MKWYFRSIQEHRDGYLCTLVTHGGGDSPPDLTYQMISTSPRSWDDLRLLGIDDAEIKKQLIIAKLIGRT